VLVRPAVSFLFKLPITFPFQRKERKEINVMGRKRKGQPGRPTKGKEYEKQRKENVEPKEFQRLFSFHFCFSIPSLWLAWPCGRSYKTSEA
tara:strand:+ start:241 stop:513 length:273 start_codon:yes stop_codon:yes gene_type:complete